VVEDTAVTHGYVLEMFGEEIANLVYDVTDQSRPTDGNRETRKRIDREHIAKASPDAMSIKLADLIDNTASITAHDPDFAVTYLREKRLLMPLLIGGNKLLYARAWSQLDMQAAA
jgi:(p)ppGpp synthase/HD superfamily hydrolase